MMPNANNRTNNDDVFDADERNSADYNDTFSSTPTPELYPKQDPAPPQSRDTSKQGCDPCGNLRHRFPRTFAIIFQVFLSLHYVNQFILFLCSTVRLNRLFSWFLHFIYRYFYPSTRLLPYQWYLDTSCASWRPQVRRNDWIVLDQDATLQNNITSINDSKEKSMQIIWR